MEPLNTKPIEQFLNQVRAAETSNQKEIRMDSATAKVLAHTLGLVMSRLHGDLEKLVFENKNSNNEIISISLDPGSGWK
jgi:hypothetical protein